MAPLKHTRSRNKSLVGRIPNGRNTQWSPDEKQALLDAIKDEKMHNLTGSDGAFKKVKKGTPLYRTRAFPYLYEVMQIEGVNLPKQAHKHVDADDEDERMVDAGEAGDTETGKSSKKEQKREKKSEKKEKEPAKPKSKKDNGNGKTPGDSKDEDSDKKRPEKAADQKPGKSAKKKAQKKSWTSEESRSDDEYEPKMADDEIPIEANSSPRSASKHEEAAKDVTTPKTKTTKREKKTESYNHETSHSEGEAPVNEVAHLKKNRNKRKQSASDSVPPSPTTSRSAKQPKITESFNSAAIGEKLKDEVSTGSCRSVSPPLEEPKLPSADEQEIKEVGDGKGKADRDAPQIATPVKTSPTPKKFADDEDNERTSAVKAELTEQERAPQEV